MNGTIRELDESYVKELIDLHEKSIVPIWKKLKREYNLEETKEYIKDTFSKGKVFGYFDKDKLVGCIGIVIYKKHNLGEIRHVLVNSKFQGRGIGKELMNYAENFCKNKVRKLRLEVLIGNKAISFYEKLNYKKKAYILEKRS